MKKLFEKGIILSLIALLFMSAIASNTVLAADDILDIKGESAMLIDGDTGRILYQKNIDTPLPPASMTKMMTEYLVLESVKDGKITWDQKTGISDYVYRISQNRDLSNVPLRKDDQYSVKELYESMAIYSANASAIALAELIAGSETSFIKMMNDKAAKLGLKDYKFVNCTGLNNSDLLGLHPQGTDANEENMMSARSVATLAYRLIHDYPEVLETSSIPVKIFREGTSDAIRMDNWNWMLPGSMYPFYDYPGVDGLKTGSTDLGGYSFTATAKRNDVRLISVVMKTDSYAGRFGESKKLLDYGFSNFTKKEIFPAGFKIEGNSQVPVVKGKLKKVDVVTQNPVSMLIKKSEEDVFEPSYQLDQSLLQGGALVAPLNKGQVVGTLSLNYKGSEDYGYLTDEIKASSQSPIVTSVEVKKANWLVLLMRGIGNLISGIFKK